MVYFLAMSVLSERDNSRALRIYISALSAVGALFGPMFLSEVGTTINNYVGGILILLAALLLFRKDFSHRSYFVSGVILGIACGFKLTNVVFALGWFAAIVVIETTYAFRPLIYSGLGAILAYIPTGCAWSLFLYKLFGNPLFPLYNRIFKSDFYAHVPMLDERFQPKSFLGALQYFPKIALDEHPTGELQFVDLRFLIAAIVFALTLPRAVEVGSGATKTALHPRSTGSEACLS